MLSFAIDRHWSATQIVARPHLRFLPTVAKRTRGVGVRNTHRPGGGPPVRPAPALRSSMGRSAAPPAAIPGAPPRPTEADGTLITPAVASPAAAAVAPSRSTPGRIKVKPDSLLAARAQQEYLYVGEDLRRIVVVAGILIAALLLAWLFFTVIDPFDIY